MTTIRTLFLVALLVLSVLTVGPVAYAGSDTAAPTAIDSCRVIDESGQYELTQDLTVDDGLRSYCIKITANNVTLDGNGHTIQGNYTRNKEYRENDALTSDPKAAVLVVGNDTLSGVAVSNVTVADWKTGVAFRDTTDSSLTGVTAEASRFEGVSLEGFDAGTVTDTTVTGTYGAALRLTGNDTLLRGNDLSNNDEMAISFTGAGLFVDGTNNSVVDSRIVDNEDAGSITGAGVTLRNTTVSNNEPLRVETDGGTVVENTVTKTRDYYESGLAVDGTDVLVARNSFEGDGVGLQVNGTRYTIVENQFDGGAIETQQFRDHGLVDSVVAQNTIQDGAITTSGALGRDRSNLTIAANDITDGDILLEAVPYATVRNNTISGSDGGITDTGITVIGTSNGTELVGNTLTNNEDGIRIESLSTITIRENVIRNNTDGVHVGNQTETTYDSSEGSDCSLVNDSETEAAVDVEIHENTITGNSAFGVHNEDETTVDATRNYWGAADGPASDSSDADAPFEDPETGTLADGSGDAVSEGPDAGVSNVHFDEVLQEPPV